jgi:hypothetical protein
MENKKYDLSRNCRCNGGTVGMRGAYNIHIIYYSIIGENSMTWEEYFKRKAAYKRRHKK